MDWALVSVGLLSFHILLTLFSLRMMVVTLRLELDDLDNKIGLALKALIESGMGEFEPPNPVQMALAELLKSKLVDSNAPAQPIEIIRDAGGKFA